MSGCSAGRSTVAAALAVVLITRHALAGPAVAVPPDGASPSEMVVPKALWEGNETIEPSGVVWAPAIERYLVISDDTGEGPKRHAPWLMAMDRQGRLDPRPVPIVGVAAVNDAESICAGPGGTFFLVTSHSPSRKGKVKPERRMLLHLRLAGRALRVIGRADLTSTRGSGGRSLLEIAGLPATGTLDIEAITMREGALLIGLKSPLTAAGSAVVLQLAEPAKALGSGRVQPGALTRLWEVPLQVQVKGGTSVSEGLSDMTVLPDGSVILLGNAPKGMPADGGGAMYRYLPGAATPTLLRRFAGLKPEGVTLSDDGKSLVLVFDNDTRAPLWLRIPIPPAVAAQ